MLFFQALSIFFQSDVSRQHCRLIPATLVFVSWFIRHFWQLFIGILWASIVSVSWIVNIKPQSLLFQNNKGNGVIVGGESWVSVPSLSECNCQSVALWISCLSEAVPEILTGSLLQTEIHQLKGYRPSSQPRQPDAQYRFDGVGIWCAHTVSTGLKSTRWGKITTLVQSNLLTRELQQLSRLECQ